MFAGGLLSRYYYRGSWAHRLIKIIVYKTTGIWAG